jgi:hypothetical protein
MVEHSPEPMIEMNKMSSLCSQSVISTAYNSLVGVKVKI